MKILFPESGVETVEDVIERGTRFRYSIKPFDESVIDFLDSLSKQLFSKARDEPSLAPLAFFMRRAATTKLAQTHRQASHELGESVPQGLIFHVPPTNVDTLFLYSLTLALVTGNANIVRISENSGPATFQVLDILFEALRESPSVSNLVTVVQFGRDAETLKAFSLSCDLRMIWGGDSSIRSVREAPISPSAKELTFPDRVSFSAIGASQWLSSDETKKNQVVLSFYNDTFWFDQMACSSPQLLIFVASDKATYEAAESDFLARLDMVAQRKYEMAEGQAINKMVAAVNGVAYGATKIEWASNYSVFLDGMNLNTAEEIRPGGGFLSTQWVTNVNEISADISRRTQTLSTFGIEQADITSLVKEINGRGIDRVVPIGNALDFNVVWDGKNLVSEMLRLVTIDASI